MVNLVDLEDLVLRKLDEVLFAPSAKEILVKKISDAYEKRTSAITDERETLLQQKNKTSRRMDILYTQIEEGLADKYDLKRLKKVKEEMTAIRNKLNELDDRPKAQLSAEQVETLLNHFQSAIKTKSADNLRALIENFILKVTISRDKTVITYKINLFCTNGAVEGT